MIIILKNHEVSSKDGLVLNVVNVSDLNGANNTDLFNFKQKITCQTDDNGTEKVEIAVPLKHLKKDFWKCLKLIVKLKLFWIGLKISSYHQAILQIKQENS